MKPEPTPENAKLELYRKELATQVDVLHRERLGAIDHRANHEAVLVELAQVRARVAVLERVEKDNEQLVARVKALTARGHALEAENVALKAAASAPTGSGA